MMCKPIMHYIAEFVTGMNRLYFDAWFFGKDVSTFGKCRDGQMNDVYSGWKIPQTISWKSAKTNMTVQDYFSQSQAIPSLVYIYWLAA